jgi:hypothetical protein
VSESAREKNCDYRHLVDEPECDHLADRAKHFYQLLLGGIVGNVADKYARHLAHCRGGQGSETDEEFVEEVWSRSPPQNRRAVATETDAQLSNPNAHSASMPKVKTKKTRFPDGWEQLEPYLNELEKEMRMGAYCASFGVRALASFGRPTLGVNYRAHLCLSRRRR